MPTPAMMEAASTVDVDIVVPQGVEVLCRHLETGAERRFTESARVSLVEGRILRRCWKGRPHLRAARGERRRRYGAFEPLRVANQCAARCDCQTVVGVRRRRGFFRVTGRCGNRRRPGSCGWRWWAGDACWDRAATTRSSPSSRFTTSATSPPGRPRFTYWRASRTQRRS